MTPAASNPAPEIDRMESADAAAMLDRFAGGDLIQRGSVNVISVEAIRARSGERWGRKRDAVWAYVERKLNEHLAHQDLHQRISETDFLIAMTSEHGMAAQAVALKVLEEVLHYFLGRADRSDMRIKSVRSVNGRELNCATIDPTIIVQARDVREDTGDSPYRAGIDPAEERKRNPVSFVASSGRALRVDYALEHLISLKHGVTAALRIEPTVTELATGRVIPVRQFKMLDDEDLAFIDRSTVDYGGLFLPESDARSRPALIVPASFRSMGSRKGRTTLIAQAGLAPERVKASIMVELVDVDRGTPQGRLLEVAGLLNTLCRGVFGRVMPVKDAVEALRGARLMGITLDAGDIPITDSRLASAILLFGQQARGLASAIAVRGLPTEGFFAVAEVAGLTHASVKGPSLTAERAA
jgi:hypothetical protein